MPDDSSWHEGRIEAPVKLPRIWNPVRWIKWQYYRRRARQYSGELFHIEQRGAPARHIDWLESQNRKYSDLARKARFGAVDPP